MRVPAPRLGQLAHLFSANTAAVFGHRSMLASLRRHRDPFAPCAVLPSPTGSTNSNNSDLDPKFDAETVPDDSTLVDSRRQSSHSEEADSFSLSDVPEDEPPDTSARRSIIYPLPSAENLLAHEPTPPASMIDASTDPPLCTPLTPPPAHYKRRRAHIMSDEDHDPDPDSTSISLYTDPQPESTLRFPF
ncbi:hypothetical protein BJV74DRAFT_498472 [Russula compacta]|nr:hypothetical protein BJV74DRAFT_498472 [Russula compacta]